ncbi:MAG TPA: LapA family protein [Paracoccus sp. (in: a-proteobacteria)]|nr:LapA family protein [Paracoccus sp. (in: a-proteobacteria)]
MRYLRLFLVVLLAIVLVGLALANRSLVTVSLLPAETGPWLGEWSVRMPLFLLILLSVMIGMVLGLIWEWLREAHIRHEASRRANKVAQLEREVGGLRKTHAAPRDEVLAILEAPRAIPPAPAAPAGAGLPAPR